MPKLTVIINSWNEPTTIGKCIECIANPKYSGIPNDFELLQVSPDKETLDVGLETAKKLGLGKKYIQIQDPKKGKPYALNMALKKSRGKIIIMTDGDTHFGKNAVAELIKPFAEKKIGAVTGCEYSKDDRGTMMKYYGHLLASAADHNRKSLTEYNDKADYYVSKDSVIPLSGRCYAIRNIDIEIPQIALAEDGLIGAKIFDAGYKLAYNPKATVFARYPLTLNDHIKQKIRSLGGYPQLKRLGLKTGKKSSRKFFDEIKYFWFPFAFAKNFKEVIWSTLLFPIRLWTWFKIKVEMRKLERKMVEQGGWDRVVSAR